MKINRIGNVGAFTHGVIVLAMVASMPGPASGEEAVGVFRTRVALEDAGEEPRQEFRYEVEPGTTERVELTFDARVEMTSAGDKTELALATVILTIDLHIDEVEGDVIQYTGEYTGLRTAWSEFEGVPAPPRSVRVLLEPLLDARFSGRITDRGVILESEFDPRQELSAESYGMIVGSAFHQPMLLLVETLPAEPVGNEGRWRVETEPESFGITFERTLTNELKSMEDAEAIIEQRMTVAAEDQEMVVPRSPPDIRDHLIDNEADGERTSRIRLDRLTRVEATLTTDTTATLERRTPEGRTETRQQIHRRYLVRTLD